MFTVLVCEALKNINFLKIKVYAFLVILSFIGLVHMPLKLVEAMIFLPYTSEE